MSSFKAIAAVTASLRTLLSDVSKDVVGCIVITRPPGSIVVNQNERLLNIYLYQVKTNPAFGTFDLPQRDSNGMLVNRSTVAINLHYILTAYTDENEDIIAQQILGSAMRILQERPVLTPDLIRAAILSNPQDELADSDLADQVEMVKLTLESLTLEEITKLWSSFFQINYRTSVCYLATVVLIDSRIIPAPSLPVSQQGIYAIQYRHILLDRIDPAVVKRGTNRIVTLLGKNLMDVDTVLKVGDQSLQLIPTSTNNEIKFQIPVNLSPGIKAVQVIKKMNLGSNPDQYNISESNILAIVILPRQVNVLTPQLNSGDVIQIKVEPAVLAGQKASLMINNSEFGNYSFPSLPPTAGLPPDILEFQTHDLPSAEYLVRIQVDGAISIPNINEDPTSPDYGKFIGPTVKVQ
jgi:Pvc16 N-terminal domain/IPT/TIG domain